MSKFIDNCFEKINANIDPYPHIYILWKIVTEKLHNFKEQSITISEVIIKDLLRSINDTYERVNIRF